VPAAAVGRLAGVKPVNAAPGSTTVILIVTTIVEPEVPEVIVTVPVRTVPGEEESNTNGLKVMLIVVPKL
jgi:hypothetical protein